MGWKGWRLGEGLSERDSPLPERKARESYSCCPQSGNLGTSPWGLSEELEMEVVCEGEGGREVAHW